MVEKQKGDDSRTDSIKEAAGDPPVRMADQKTSKDDESKLRESTIMLTEATVVESPSTGAKEVKKDEEKKESDHRRSSRPSGRRSSRLNDEDLDDSFFSVDPEEDVTPGALRVGGTGSTVDGEQSVAPTVEGGHPAIVEAPVEAEVATDRDEEIEAAIEDRQQALEENDQLRQQLRDLENIRDITVVDGFVVGAKDRFSKVAIVICVILVLAAIGGGVAAAVLGNASTSPTPPPTQPPTRAPNTLAPTELGGTRSPTRNPTRGPTPNLTPPPTPEPTPPPTADAPDIGERRTNLETILDAHRPFDQDTFDWLVETDTWEPPDSAAESDRMWIQRYALASFFLASNENSWIVKNGWLSSNSVCSGWFGVSCSGETVTQLRLGTFSRTLI
jgi:hypothetical protein